MHGSFAVLGLLAAPPPSLLPRHLGLRAASATRVFAAPRCLMDLTPQPGERRAAVERILQVELDRLVSAVQLNWERLTLPSHMRKATPAPTSDEIAQEMEARTPMLRWATVTWLRSSLGIDTPGVWCPTLKRLNLHPWQWTPNEHPTLTTPTLVQSLRALRPSLTNELRQGLRNRPWRVCRLAYRAAVVYALAALSWLPGPQRKMIQRTWPRLVNHLAVTLEQNYRLALGIDEPKQQEWWRMRWGEMWQQQQALWQQQLAPWQQQQALWQQQQAPWQQQALPPPRQPARARGSRLRRLFRSLRHGRERDAPPSYLYG